MQNIYKWYSIWWRATPVLGNILVKINVTNISHYPFEPVSISNNLTFFHTTIKMPILQTIQLTLPNRLHYLHVRQINCMLNNI